MIRLVDYPISTIRAQDAFSSPRLNSALTQADRLRVRGEELVSRSGVVKLFGVNIGVGTLDFPGAFEFLSSIGVNLLRSMLPYREWDESGPKKPPRSILSLKDQHWDALFKQQYLCEQNGIYVIYSDFNRGLGLNDFPTGDAARLSLHGAPDSCVAGIWHSRVRAVILERMRRFLTAYNPYTERPFGVSPSLLGIQVVNEAMWFANDLYLPKSKNWSAMLASSENLRREIASLAGVEAATLTNLNPQDRISTLARATAEAYKPFKEFLIKEFGSDRPLLIGDNSSHAGGAAFEAFEPCDAYGVNLYPNFGPESGANGPVKAHDLRRETYLDRMQIRLAGKPTIVTETGERLAPGGMSRLIADMTVRAAVYNYAGIAFHEMYRGIYGEYSGKPEWLSSRAPLLNNELSTDPAAICALQACSAIFRKQQIKSASRQITVFKPAEAFISKAVLSGIQTENLLHLVSAFGGRVANRVGELTTAIKIAPSSRDEIRETEDLTNTDTIQTGHVRAGEAEIDWHTDTNPENDYLFLRAPLDGARRLIIIVGRSKPDPANQRFLAGHATLDGLIQYPWPDPRTGYGTRQLVRRPRGPAIRVRGEVYGITPTGAKGARVAIRDGVAEELPETDIRFLELLETTPKPKLSQRHRE